MPGITASLSNAAFAIWEEVPRKSRKSALGAAGDEGRSAWLSEVIIDHYQEMKRFKHEVEFHVDEKLALMRKLRAVRESRDRLQEVVLERTDGPKS